MSENSDFVRNAYKAVLAVDIPAIRELLSDDIVWHTCGWGPLKGDYRGKDAVIEMFSRFRTMTDGLDREEVETFLEDGNRVVTVMTSTQEGNPHITSKHVDIWDFRDGKLVEYWGIQADQEAGAKALS
jgi:ketosteroid isomerase-like protein